MTMHRSRLALAGLCLSLCGVLFTTGRAERQNQLRQESFAAKARSHLAQAPRIARTTWVPLDETTSSSELASITDMEPGASHVLPLKRAAAPAAMVWWEPAPMLNSYLVVADGPRVPLHRTSPGLGLASDMPSSDVSLFGASAFGVISSPHEAAMLLPCSWRESQPTEAVATEKSDVAQVEAVPQRPSTNQNPREFLANLGVAYFRHFATGGEKVAKAWYGLQDIAGEAWLRYRYNALEMSYPEISRAIAALDAPLPPETQTVPKVRPEIRHIEPNAVAENPPVPARRSNPLRVAMSESEERLRRAPFADATLGKLSEFIQWSTTIEELSSRQNPLSKKEIEHAEAASSSMPWEGPLAALPVPGSAEQASASHADEGCTVEAWQAEQGVKPDPLLPASTADCVEAVRPIAQWASRALRLMGDSLLSASEGLAVLAETPQSTSTRLL